MKRGPCDACCLSAAHIKPTCENGFDKVILELGPGQGPQSLEGVVATRRTVQISTEKNATFDSLRSALVKARMECDIVVLSGDHESVLRRVADSEDHLLVDAVRIDLSSIGMLKQALVRQIAAHGIMLEICVNQLFAEDTRAKCLANARHVVRTFVRHSKRCTNLVLAVGAKTPFELRSVEELKAIGALMGLSERDVSTSVTVSPYRLIERAYFRRIAFLESKPKNAIYSTMTQQSVALSGGQNTSAAAAARKRSSEGGDINQEGRKRSMLWNAS